MLAPSTDTCSIFRCGGNMAGKKKTASEKRLTESEKRLTSALEKLAKATQSHLSRQAAAEEMAGRSSELEAELKKLGDANNVLTEELEKLKGESQSAAESFSLLKQQYEDLQESFERKQVPDADELATGKSEDPSASFEQVERVKKAVRDRLDEAIGRIEALLASGLQKAT